MKETNYSVYLIKLDGVVMYVGKTNNFRKRKNDHLRIGTKNSAIPEGTDLSKVTIIKAKDFSDREEALKYEDELILQYDTINNGWNKRRSGLICAEDKKAYMKRWNEENKEELKAYKQGYYEEHKEEKKAYGKKYREEHREEVNARTKKWLEEHKEERKAYELEHREEKRAYDRKYRKEHREESKASLKKYRDEHRDEYNAYMREYNKKRKLSKQNKEE